MQVYFYNTISRNCEDEIETAPCTRNRTERQHPHFEVMDEEDDNESDVIEIKKPCNHHAEFAPTMILLPSSDQIDSAVKSETDEV